LTVVRLRYWEYLLLNLCDAPRGGKDVDLLEDAGSRGWELVAITAKGLAYLKREIKEPARARATLAPHGIK
jgi:hypothetical protein